MSPEGPSLQGYPQLHPGQGSLGGPVDLQQNQGGLWVCRRQRGPGWPPGGRTRQPGAAGTRGQILALTSMTVYWREEHSPPLEALDNGHLVQSWRLANVISRTFSPFQAFAQVVASISSPFAMPGVYFRSFFRPHLRCHPHWKPSPPPTTTRLGLGFLPWGSHTCNVSRKNSGHMG